MITIGIDASQANRKIRSGTEWYAFEIITRFKKLLKDREDVKVRLYVRDVPQDDIADDLPSNFEIKILEWPFPFLWVQGRLSLEMMANPPDTLFCPAHTIPLVHPIATYTTLHDVGFRDHPELYPWYELLYHRFSAWWATKRAQHIFTISKFSKQKIQALYHVPDERLNVTLLGFDTVKCKTHGEKPDDTLLSEMKLTHRGYFLYIGRIERKKNVLNMIKAYEETDTDIPFVIAGRRVHTEDIDEYLAHHPELAKKIKFLGYVAEDVKYTLLRNAFVFVFVTGYEGFGLPIVEAQACGVPVVTSDTTSNPEIAGDAALLVSPNNVAAISGAIQKMISDDELRKNLVEKGLHNIKRFNWDQTANKTLEKILYNA